MRTLIFAYIFFAATLPTTAQRNWESQYDGFVVTNDNRKITGFTRKLGVDKDNGSQIQLLKEPGGKPQLFFASELLGYAVKGDTFRVFRSLQLFVDNDETVPYAEALILENGRLVLYDLQQVPAQPVWVSTGPNTPRMATYPVTHTKLIRKPNGELIGISKENFRDEMKSIVKDAPDIVEKIEQGKLRFKQLRKVVKEYNGRF